MDALIDLPWRLYPTAALAAGGLALAALSLERGVAGIRLPSSVPGKSLVVMWGFRLAVIGLAIAGIAAAWLWRLTWLLVLALVIGGEETLESTLIIFALTNGARLRIRVAAR